MNIITLTPPWGSLIAVAALRPELGKHIETRGWRLPAAAVGVPLAIHQAKTLPRGFSEADLIARCAWSRFRLALAALGITEAAQLPRGEIVAVVVPHASVPTSGHGAFITITHGERDWRVPPLGPDLDFGDYSRGRFAWPLDQIRALAQPLPYRGSQGLRRLPAEIAALVEAQL